jgi:hypothetical protein
MPIALCSMVDIRMRISVIAIVTAFFVGRSALAAPDTLVVCPQEFRSTLVPWEEMRRAQGHEIEIIDVPEAAADLQSAVVRVAASGQLKYLVLIGDVPTDTPMPRLRGPVVPTNFVPAKVNVRWGSEPMIASDFPFADINGDGSPDLVVGRIPADSPEELAAVVRKIVRYETHTEHEPWERKLAAVAGTGDFGPLADGLIEAAGQQLMEQALPPGFIVDLKRAKTGAAALAPVRNVSTAASDSSVKSSSPVRRSLGQQIDNGSLVWAYFGHGNATELDYIAGPNGPESILSVKDVARLRGGALCPLAMLISCHTGACDAPRDCLAEELILAEDGPVSVLAATRISMPYGNAIFSYEFLRASLVDHPATLGMAFRLAQQRSLAVGAGDPMRSSIDTMALAMCPLLPSGGERWRPEDLVVERKEHVAMYHLLGDPLLRWRRPRPLPLKVAPQVVIAGSTIEVEGIADFGGNCLIELSRNSPADTSRDLDSTTAVVDSQTQRVDAGPFRVSVTLPTNVAGQFIVRAYLRGKADSAVGGAPLEIRNER